MSDLAEYSYCPRAAWYRLHPPPGAPDGASVRALERGQRFHRSHLERTVRRESSGTFGWSLIALAVLLLALAFYLGGVR